MMAAQAGGVTGVNGVNGGGVNGAGVGAGNGFDEKLQNVSAAAGGGAGGQQQQPGRHAQAVGTQPQSASDSPRSNLIINFIPRAMDDKQLQQLFAPYGDIETVKIVMERGTNQHLGYGFVKFKLDKDAQQAIDALNGFPVGEKTLKVGVARPRHETGRRSNLYVSGLPETMDADQMRNLFAPYGTIIECRVLYDKAGVSRKVGFVRFELNAQAEQAIQSLNNQIPAGAPGPIYVKHAAPPQSKQTQPAFPGNMSAPEYMAMATMMAQNPGAFTAAAAAGIPAFNMFANQHNQFQHAYGGYQRNRMMFNPRQRFNPMAQQPGAPFNQFGGNQVAMNHQQQQQQHHHQGGASAGGQDPQSCIFVFHLPHEATEQELRDLFSPFGQITSIKIMIHPVIKKPKGFGFVNFMRREEAERAINALDGHQMGNKYLKLSFKK